MINKRLIEYAEARTTPEDPVLAKLNRETHLTQVYPQMLSGHLQGTLLRMISRMVKPRRILEIGTFTGYSAINLATGLDGMEQDDGRGAMMHTIEVNPEQEEGIRKYIREAGLEDRINLHIGNALGIIPELDETWDLVYIDADKPNYLNYYNLVFPHLREGGFILADNALWDGKVTGDPEKMDKDTRGIAEFNRYVHEDPRVENLLLPFRDGIMLIRKR
jgi:caffeoyl-CoA O-methyltransferase